jgi:hypothetical protein
MNEKRRPNAAGIIGFLWEKFDAHSASDEELELLGGAGDEACTLSRNTADRLLGVAMHIADENAAGRDVRKMAHVDLPVLLANIADAMTICGELAFIGSEANFVASQRAEAKIKSSRVQRGKQSERESQ